MAQAGNGQLASEGSADRTSRPIVLRMDDVGASSKRYEVYSRLGKRFGRLGAPGDWLFLKYLPGLRAWGPYPELSARQWRQIVAALERHNARLTVGVTATWAEAEDRLIPYPERFPEAAAVLKEACRRGTLEIANHGLTHCITKDNVFKPRWFSSNRLAHREFSSATPLEIQRDHIQRSQRVLQDCFETAVVTFAPPGKQFSLATLAAAQESGLRYLVFNRRARGTVLSLRQAVSYLREGPPGGPPSEEETISVPLLDYLLDRAAPGQHFGLVSFHDRDVALGGTAWLKRFLAGLGPEDYLTAREAGRTSEQVRSAG